MDNTPTQAHSAQQATGLTLGPDVARPVWLHRPQSSMAMLATEGCWRLLGPKFQSTPSAGPQAHSEQVTWLPLTRGPCPLGRWQQRPTQASSLEPPADKAWYSLASMSPADPAPPPRLGSGHDKTFLWRLPGAPLVTMGVGPTLWTSFQWGFYQVSASQARPLVPEGCDNSRSSQAGRMEG